MESRNLAPRAVIFLEENPASVLSTFLALKSSGRSTHAVWCEPSSSRLEIADPFEVALLRDITARFPLLDDDDHAVTSKVTSTKLCTNF